MKKVGLLGFTWCFRRSESVALVVGRHGFCKLLGIGEAKMYATIGAAITIQFKSKLENDILILLVA